jgi:hypothetical protein
MARDRDDDYDDRPARRNREDDYDDDYDDRPARGGARPARRHVPRHEHRRPHPVRRVLRAIAFVLRFGRLPDRQGLEGEVETRCW